MTDREQDLARQIADASANERMAEALDVLGVLRRDGLLRRPTYRLTSPYGSGVDCLSKTEHLEEVATPW